MEYMRYYETLYLIRPDLEPEEYKAIIEKYNKLIEDNSGVVIKVEEWGKRALAYEVKRFKDGFYVLVRFCGDTDLPDRLHRDFKLDERILKFIVVKLKDKVKPDELKQKEMPSGSKAEEEVKTKDGSK